MKLTSDQKKEILLLGFYGHLNCGDVMDAIKKWRDVTDDEHYILHNVSAGLAGDFLEENVEFCQILGDAAVESFSKATEYVIRFKGGKTE